MIPGEMIREVKQERTGWRDEALSQRHRRWGFNCPATDIDLLFAEYDKGITAGIVEYKHERAKPQYATHPSYQALIELGNKALKPVFAVRYADDFSWWRVTPLNEIARHWLTEKTQMTEREYVTFLYKLRGYPPPEKLFEEWNTEI